MTVRNIDSANEQRLVELFQRRLAVDVLLFDPFVPCRARLWLIFLLDND